MGVGDAGRVGRAEEEGKEAETASACPQILPGACCCLCGLRASCTGCQHMPNMVTSCLTLWFWALADLWCPGRTLCVALRASLGGGALGPETRELRERDGWALLPALVASSSCLISTLPHCWILSSEQDFPIRGAHVTWVVDGYGGQRAQLGWQIWGVGSLCVF